MTQRRVSTVMRTFTSTAVFSPDDVAGLQAWWDFSDITTLWKDTSRTSAVTADGDIIKGVTNLSGNAKHLSETTNGPTYKTAIQNSKSVARFDGSDDTLAATITQAQPDTIFIVGIKSDAGTNHLLDGDVGRQIVGGWRVSGYSTYAGSFLQPGVAIDAAHHILVGMFNGASSKAYTDGGTGASGDPGSNGLSTSATLCRSGASFNKGDIDEMLIYSGALSSANINSIGTYLGTKWGLTWTTAS